MHVSINKQVVRFQSCFGVRSRRYRGVNDVFSFPKSKRAKIQYVVDNMLPASRDVGEPVTDHCCYRN